MKNLKEKGGDSNILISPLSISLALWMVSQGADAKTQQELCSILKVSNLTESKDHEFLSDFIAKLSSSKQAEFLCANSVWTKKLALKPEFKNLVETHYKALVSPLSSAKEVDDWVTKSTKGKITTVGSIPDSVSLILINALYFKGTFETPFNKSLTKPSTFKTAKGDNITIDFMHRNGYLPYSATSDYASIKLKYAGADPHYECLLFLPNDHKKAPSSLIDKIFSENKFLTLYSDKKVNVTMPKFSVKFEESSFLDVLKSQGFKTNNFPNVAADMLNIQSIVHKTTLEMNEEGTEASATTSINMMRSAVTTPPQFVADRPFLLVLMECSSQAVLFVGEINHPETLQKQEAQ